MRWTGPPFCVSLTAASSLISRTRGDTSGNLVPVATGPWSDDEINTTVDIYFQMLTLELAEEPYVKAAYQREVARTVDRSIGSIGKKLSNISAVLDEINAVWIPGYRTACRRLSWVGRERCSQYRARPLADSRAPRT